MKYIWGIYNIYQTPSAIPFPPNVITSPPPPPIPDRLTCSLPQIAQEFIR